MLKPLTTVQKGVLAGLAVVIVASASWVAYRRTQPLPLSPPPAGGYPTQAPHAPSTTILVDVGGAVNHPGLYTLRGSSPRTGDAIEMAGGFAPNADRDSINLAARLKDGAKVLVKMHPAPAAIRRSAPASSSTAAAASAPGGLTPRPSLLAGEGGSQHRPTTEPPAPGPPQPVSLNSATLAQLEQLPGVGPVTAQAILDYRQQHGFRRVEELMMIKGLGPAKFQKLQPYVVP